MALKNWQKIAVVIGIVTLVGGAGFLLNSRLQTIAASTCVNTTTTDYNRGYIQAVQDMVTLAYGNGIVRIPFNETHNYALMPWDGMAR